MNVSSFQYKWNFCELRGLDLQEKPFKFRSFWQWVSHRSIFYELLISHKISEELIHCSASETSFNARKSMQNLQEWSAFRIQIVGEQCRETDGSITPSVVFLFTSSSNVFAKLYTGMSAVNFVSWVIVLVESSLSESVYLYLSVKPFTWNLLT